MENFLQAERLFSAVRQGKLEEVSLIGQKAGLVNMRDVLSGNTPLHFASANGDCAMIELLAQLGGDVNSCDNDSSSSPLGVASIAGRLDAVRILLKLGARLAPEEDDIMDEVIELGDLEIAKLLRESLVRHHE